MHIRTYALGITLSLGVTISWFGGCGGTTVENTGAGTTTGTGGTTGSTSTSTTTGSTTSASTASTTSESLCQQACAHVQTCTNGLGNCSDIGINCATAGSQYDCLANCVNNTSCANFGLATLTTCEHMCNPDAGPVDAGPDASPCDQACAHVESCSGGLFGCSTIGINCATVGAGFDCLAECIDNTPCTSLGLGTYTACQGQCGGDAGASDAGPG
jgi:hypothetical protein